MGFILGLPAAVIAWFLTVIIPFALLSGVFGQRHPVTQTTAAICVIIVGPLFGYGALCWVMTAYAESKERNAEKRAAEKRMKERQIQREKDNAIEKMAIQELVLDVTKLKESLPALLDRAAFHVSRAEIELKDDSVGAFWDEVENATRCFAQYSNGVEAISSISENHAKRRAALPVQYQPEPLALQALADGEHIVLRMGKLVKQARRNPQWESIFQQRRTNDILVHGFHNLGNALETLQEAIASRFNDLAETLHSSLENLASDYSSALSQDMNQLMSAHSENSREQRKFEQTIRANADRAVDVLESMEKRHKIRFGH